MLDREQDRSRDSMTQAVRMEGWMSSPEYRTGCASDGCRLSFVGARTTRSAPSVGRWGGVASDKDGPGRAVEATARSAPNETRNTMMLTCDASSSRDRSRSRNRTCNVERRDAAAIRSGPTATWPTIEPMRGVHARSHGTVNGDGCGGGLRPVNYSLTRLLNHFVCYTKDGKE